MMIYEEPYWTIYNKTKGMYLSVISKNGFGWSENHKDAIRFNYEQRQAAQILMASYVRELWHNDKDTEELYLSEKRGYQKMLKMTLVNREFVFVDEEPNEQEAR